VRAVFDAWYPRAVRLGVLSGLGMDRAQDCAQDTFVHAFERRDQLRDPEAFAVWIYRILTRRHMDEFAVRTEACNILPDEGDVAEDWTRNQVLTPDELALSEEQREAIWRQVQQLPSSYRVPIVLRYYHGLSTREIADMVGLTHGALRVTLHRAIQRLRLSMVADSSHLDR
jgi:RNA polymerase sigma-70 factor (ECF subfamily)